MMNVTRIQNLIINISKSNPKNSSTMFNRRHPFNYMPIQISIIMLREVNEISRSMVINSYINSWQLIQPNVMISHS